MDPITVSATISRPREEIFEYLADIANHAEFTDHYLVDWRLTREDSYGRGAGARFRIKAPLNRFGWADMTLAEVQAPFRIVERGRGGKFNRIKMIGVYELSPGSSGTTRVTYTFETDPVMPSDRLMEVFGGRAWTRRKAGKAMRRLRSIMENGQGRGHHVSISAR
ncbi:MAG TPA: SRPBCC family protein [Solirubrobacteraceae bacterium]|nr:SRPBCC family protein [Solirubrobacteraceae bacterium]